MKTIKFAVIISVCVLLFSCPEDNPSEGTYYSKCFFLDENSFTFEGETFNNYTPPVGWPENEPFESVLVRFRSNLYMFEPYEGWEISGTNISNNKFRIEIDKTANGITIDKDIITECFISPYMFLFPDNFPVAELMFCFNGSNWSYNEPLLKELRYLSKTEYNYYACQYVYIAEPIDLSGIRVLEGQGKFGYYVDTYYDDLNFSRPGWYKIDTNYHSKFGNDSKFSSTKDNYFNF